MDHHECRGIVARLLEERHAKTHPQGTTNTTTGVHVITMRMNPQGEYVGVCSQEKQHRAFAIPHEDVVNASLFGTSYRTT